jgi:hypothetical protein
MKLKKLAGVENQVVFECPGCERLHIIQYGSGSGPRWGFNGDFNRPTFTPSILVKSSQMTDKGKADYDMWSQMGFPARDGGFESAKVVCHSYITDGQIKFLNDCTHKLKSSTVDLPDVDI